MARVRFWNKESWRLWFGIWVLYFHRMWNITYQVLEVDWPFDIEYENGWSRDLDNLPLASNGDNGNLQNCWCLECCFPVRSTFLELATWKIQMIFHELITTCPLSNHIKTITKIFQLGCRTALRRRWPPMKMTRQICRVPVFGCHCGNESSFFSSHVAYQWKLLKIVFSLIPILICMCHLVKV